MVRTINIYYNNRSVQAVVELKNKPGKLFQSVRDVHMFLVCLKSNFFKHMLVSLLPSLFMYKGSDVLSTFYQSCCSEHVLNLMQPLLLQLIFNNFKGLK